MPDPSPMTAAQSAERCADGPRPGPTMRLRDSRVAAVIGISRVCKMTGATPRAIRHYETVGLLSPIRAADGGRWFTPEQAAMAETIVLLRRLDVPIEEIRAILSPVRFQDRRTAITAALEAKAAELEGRLTDVRQALAGAAVNKPDSDARDLDRRDATRRVIDFERRTRRTR